MRIQYEYTQKQYLGVAIEGMDIWYMGIIFWVFTVFQMNHFLLVVLDNSMDHGPLFKLTVKAILR